MKKILYVASECAPFIKTGGLADVVGALPKNFDKSKYDVRVVIPNYTVIPERFQKDFQYVTHFYIKAGEWTPDSYVGVMQYELDGVLFYFIDNKHYFGGSTPYGDTRSDIEKFCFFSKAVLSMLPSINFRPDIIHCHDWQAGIIPVYLKTTFSDNSFYHGIKSIMTIHNLKFQGVWDIKTIKGFSGLPDYVFTPDKLEFKKDANMLKGGIVYADLVTTVSETYAYEIQTPEYGEGLNGLLFARRDSLRGIINGIDYDVYNPSTDQDIFENYSVKDFRKRKEINKLGLQKELGMPEDKNKFMIGMITRLTDQKGLDLVKYIMGALIDDHTQFVVIGTGDENYENAFRHYEWHYKGRVSSNIFYSDNRARKLYAASDAMLIPSRFEPCGLTQLMALRYGSVPIVRETGGLKDTVEPYNEFESKGVGFSFSNYNAHELLTTINYAKKTYFEQRRMWNKMIDRGMERDFSWNNSVQKYMNLYDYM